MKLQSSSVGIENEKVSASWSLKILYYVEHFMCSLANISYIPRSHAAIQMNVGMLLDKTARFFYSRIFAYVDLCLTPARNDI